MPIAVCEDSSAFVRYLVKSVLLPLTDYVNIMLPIIVNTVLGAF